jgi:hypothetical protein
MMPVWEDCQIDRAQTGAQCVLEMLAESHADILAVFVSFLLSVRWIMNQIRTTDPTSRGPRRMTADKRLCCDAANRRANHEHVPSGTLTAGKGPTGRAGERQSTVESCERPKTSVKGAEGLRLTPRLPRPDEDTLVIPATRSSSERPLSWVASRTPLTTNISEQSTPMTASASARPEGAARKARTWQSGTRFYSYVVARQTQGKGLAVTRSI